MSHFSAMEHDSQLELCSVAGVLRGCQPGKHLLSAIKVYFTSKAVGMAAQQSLPVSGGSLLL